jgi:hypothetical protein
MAQAPAGKIPLGKNRVVRPPPTEPVAPRVETEQPRLARLTAVVAVCFSIGFAWPVFGKLNFVQRPPGSATPKPEEVEPTPIELDPNAPGLEPIEVPVMRAAPITTKQQAVRIESHVVQSCQGDSGEVAARCDTPNLEGVIEAPIARLAACKAASGTSGVLSLGLFLDFAIGRVTRVKLGQSTTLAKGTAAALVRCAEEVVIGTRLDDVEHEHTSYWMYHLVRFLPPGSAVDPDSVVDPPVVSATGQATIGYATGVVRDEPSRRARVTARLPYGARVNVTARAGEWYRVERGGKALGWLHRKAIGM